MPRCSARRSATACGLPTPNLIVEVERDLTTYGEEVKFGGGKVIRDGMGQSQRSARDCADTVITNALVVDWTGHRQMRSRDQGRTDRAARQGGQPGHPARRRHRHRPGHRDHRRRRHARHGGRHRLAHPLHLPAADRRRAGVGRHDDDRRRHGPRHRHVRRRRARPGPGTSSGCSKPPRRYR